MTDEQPAIPDILDFDIEHERKPHNREGNHGYYYCDLLNSEHGGPTYECNCGLPEAIAAYESLLTEHERFKAALEGIRTWAKERWDDGIEFGTSGDTVLDNLSKTMLRADKALADIKDGN